MTVEVEAFYDEATGTITYAVADRATRECAIVDSVLGEEGLERGPAARVLRHVVERALTARWILDTHVHADHVSAAFALSRRLGGTTGIGAGIVELQRRVVPATDPERAGAGARAPYQRLLREGDALPLGEAVIRVLETPGHTPSCVSYLIEDCAFVGDTLFVPRAGTARCDFPGGDPATLYRSVRRLLELPAGVRIFSGHDYGPSRGEPPSWESTVGEQRAGNVHVRYGVTLEAFVEMRRRRDRALPVPALYRRAIDANLFGGAPRAA